MNFKLDVNYLDSLIKTSQSTEKFEDPIKKTIQLGLQASCSIYVRSGKKNWSGSGFHVGNNIIITAGHVVPTDETLTEILITFDNKNFTHVKKIFTLNYMLIIKTLCNIYFSLYNHTELTPGETYMVISNIPAANDVDIEDTAPW